MMETIDKLKDLIVQATKEKSHYYVKSVCEEAIARIEGIEQRLEWQTNKCFQLEERWDKLKEMYGDRGVKSTNTEDGYTIHHLRGEMIKLESEEK